MRSFYMHTRWGNPRTLCFFFLFMSFITSGVAANTRSAVTEWFYPYQIINDENDLTGYAIELADLLFQNAGEQGNIKLLPWSVAYNTALSSPDTLIFLIGRNAIREQQFHWIGPVASDILYFYALHGSPIEASENLQDFKQYRISVVKDATTHQFLKRAQFPNIYPMPATDSNADEQVRIKMLINKRADLLIASKGAIRWSLGQLALPENSLKIVYRASPLDTQLYFAFNKNSDIRLVKKYQNALEQIKITDKYQQLRKKWQVE